MAHRKRKVLTLEEMRSVITKLEEGCSISEELDVGKTQIQNISKRKKIILKDWNSGKQSEKSILKQETMD